MAPSYRRRAGRSVSFLSFFRPTPVRFSADHRFLYSSPIPTADTRRRLPGRAAKPPRPGRAPGLHRAHCSAIVPEPPVSERTHSWPPVLTRKFLFRSPAGPRRASTCTAFTRNLRRRSRLRCRAGVSDFSGRTGRSRPRSSPPERPHDDGQLPACNDAARRRPAASAVADVHTTNFPALLREIGASLLVTTYQAGKLVMVRAEGDHLNTHFRAFPRPDGAGPRRRPAGHRHPLADLGIPQRARPPPARLADGPARRLLPAALVPRHRQRPGPRDGLGRRRAVVRQHPVLVPLHARSESQLRAALAAAVRVGSRRGPLPLERPGRW